MHKIIIHNNKDCQILAEDQQLLNLLRSTFSYKESGVEYSQAYKNGWDGRTNLISKKGMFFLGLFTQVSQFLVDHKLSFETEDLRPALKNAIPIDLSKILEDIKMQPRDYQERIVSAACNSRNGIVRACTGSGKTLCTALITAQLNKPTIIYVIGLDLLKQFHDLFTTLFNEPIGYIGDGVCKIERINIASIWTIGSALNISKKDICTDDEFDCKEKVDLTQKEKILGLLEQTKVHIFDECHVVTCNTIQSIHKKINPEHIYGFSGTPYRDDNTDLLIHGILGEQIVDVPASELIEKGILAQPIIKFVAIPHMSMPLAQYQTVYKTYISDNDIRNMIILQRTKDLLIKKYTPLVLFKHIKHGQVLYEMMNEAGIKCEMLHGNDPLKRRTQVKEMLEKKEIEVILASTIFDLGINLPILSALVLAGVEEAV